MKEIRDLILQAGTTTGEENKKRVTTEDMEEEVGGNNNDEEKHCPNSDAWKEILKNVVTVARTKTSREEIISIVRKSLDMIGTER